MIHTSHKSPATADAHSAAHSVSLVLILVVLYWLPTAAAPCSRDAELLLQAEACRVADGDGQPVSHLGAALVLGQRQHVEARVRRGQVHGVVSAALQDEAELTQPAQGRTVAACGKEEQ